MCNGWVSPRSQRALAWTPPSRCVKCTSSSVRSFTQTTTAMETDAFCRNRMASASSSCLSCSKIGWTSARCGTGAALSAGRTGSPAGRPTVPFLDFQCLERVSELVGPGDWWSGSSPFGPRPFSQSGSLCMQSDVEQRLCQPAAAKLPKRTERTEPLAFGLRIEWGAMRNGAKSRRGRLDFGSYFPTPGRNVASEKNCRRDGVLGRRCHRRGGLFPAAGAWAGGAAGESRLCRRAYPGGESIHPIEPIHLSKEHIISIPFRGKKFTCAFALAGP